MSGPSHPPKRVGCNRSGILEVRVDYLDDVRINYIRQPSCFGVLMAVILGSADADFMVR